MEPYEAGRVFRLNNATSGGPSGTRVELFPLGLKISLTIYYGTFTSVLHCLAKLILEFYVSSEFSFEN